MTLQCNFFFLFTDEIMHQDIIPLYAADIQDQLKKQFAYLSGKTVLSLLYTLLRCTVQPAVLSQSLKTFI